MAYDFTVSGHSHHSHQPLFLDKASVFSKKKKSLTAEEEEAENQNWVKMTVNVGLRLVAMNMNNGKRRLFNSRFNIST